MSNRSKKSLINVTVGVFNKCILLILAFITRTIFIRLLGAEYTGISSLYSNILSVLSLAELGMGNVMMYFLYGALREGDEEKICSLVNEFKKIYMAIIILVFSVGLLSVPFLKYIINSELNYRDLVIYYVLYLINSVASYFVVYKTTVISADQKGYISSLCSVITTFLMYLLQIVYLLISKNFLGYLIIQVSCTILNNLVLHFITGKMYPYLNNKALIKPGMVDRKSLFLDIKATFLFKISDTILDQTDSIIISVILGTIFVGYYSNYYMIISYLVGFISILVTGITASLGNLNAENNMKKSYEMFRTLMLMFALIASFCTTCYLCVIQDFIPIWIGEQYLLKYDVVIAILFVFYLRIVTNTIWLYRSTIGLFKVVQYIMLLAAAINIILSCILGKTIGLAGILGATAIARLLTSFWYEAKIIFKRFDKNAWIYFGIQAKDLLITLVIAGASMLCCKMINLSGILAIALKICICGLITLFIEYIVNGRTNEWKILRSKARSLLLRRL